jgi:hypothetical protein
MFILCHLFWRTIISSPLPLDHLSNHSTVASFIAVLRGALSCCTPRRSNQRKSPSLSRGFALHCAL